jgi:hypothetical protein
VDLAACARGLVRHLVSLYDRNSRINASADGNGLTIDLARAIPLGWPLHELLHTIAQNQQHSRARSAMSSELPRSASAGRPTRTP